MTEHTAGLEGHFSGEAASGLEEDMARIPLYLIAHNEGYAKKVEEFIGKNSGRYGMLTGTDGKYIHLNSTFKQRENVYRDMQEKSGLFGRIKDVVDEDEICHFE